MLSIATPVALAQAGGPTTVGNLYDLDTAGIESRLNAIDSAEGVDSVHKPTLKATYQTALDHLKAADADRLLATEFSEILRSATVEAGAIAQALNSLLNHSAQTDYSSLGSDEIDVTLSYERSRLSALQSELHERREEIDLLRNEQPQTKLAAAEAELAKIENLIFAKVISENDVILEARTVANRARKIAARAHINLLDQKRISYETRLNLASAAENLTYSKADRSQKQVQGLAAESLRRRNIRVDNTIERTQNLAGGIDAIPTAVREYLEGNKTSATVLVDLITSTGDVIADNSKRDADLNRLKNAYDILTEQLRVAGFNISPTLAIALRKERESLAALVEASNDPNQDLQQNIIDGRLKQIELASLLTQDEHTVVGNLLAHSSTEASADLRGAVVQLVADRHRTLVDLHSATGEHVAALGRAQSSISNQRIVFEKYRDLVDELLFWVPSAGVIQWGNLQLLGTKSLSAFSPATLGSAYQKLITALQDNPLRYLLLGASILLLIHLRKRLVKILESSGKHVGKVQSDRFRFTLLGLFVTALLSLPISLLLMLGSWVVATTGEYDPVADGLESAAYLYFLLGLYYQLCRPKGLGERHFKWQEHSLQVTRKNMRWLIAVLIPISVVTSSTEARYGQLASDTLGIIALVIGSVAISVFFHFLLKPITTSRTTAEHKPLIDTTGLGK
ncbi:MAG: potassium efflux system protein, partial [Halioglobus sp.]